MESTHVSVFALLLACVVAVSSLRLQSPIDIESERAVKIENLPDLVYKHYHSSRTSYYLSNSGHGAEIHFKNWLYLPRVSGGPLSGTYTLEQVHFHWGEKDGVGSEHYLDGHPFSMEVHLVHWNNKYKSYKEAASKKDGLAVVAFFVESLENYKNPQFQAVVDLIPSIKHETGSVAKSDKDLLAWVIPYLEPGNYYSYSGSLTTTPFSENVHWIVYDNPIVVGRKQLRAFREIENDHREFLLSNKRDLQDVDGREVDYVPLKY